MKKSYSLLPAVILLSSCGGSNNPPPPPVSTEPAITACPKKGGEEEKSYVPMDQQELLSGIMAGKGDEVFLDAFEHGDLIFGTKFTMGQGGGAFIGGNEPSHYTRIPRADLNAPGEWGDMTRLVMRPTGPNAQSCGSCHSQPVDDGAGPTSVNVHRIPQLKNPALTIQRNTPHVFGLGALQRLAEEMSYEIRDTISRTSKAACAEKNQKTEPFTAKGVNFGRVTIGCEGGTAHIIAQESALEGVSPDGVVRPYEWKKNVAFLRDFMRHAGNNEIGMQGVELVGKDVDEDHDGSKNELSVGDMTAFTVYMAAQARPVTKIELDDLGILAANKQKLKPEERKQIQRGEKAFDSIGCSTCHKPELTLDSSGFQEPSNSPYHRDDRKLFKTKGQVQVDMEAEGVKPEHPVKFDLAKDQPDNRFCQGSKETLLGAFEKHNGKTIVRLYGDLKRHWMGPDLAERVDELEEPEKYGSEEPNEEYGGHMSLVNYDPINKILPPESYPPYDPVKSKAIFGTRELWGVACTGPWMHDGRATTLKDAIELHGGEAEESSEKFKALSESEQKDLIAFLGNLVLYVNTAENGKTPDPLSEQCEVKG
ncbi:di-heme oxidoredictase family protein [Methylomicrobium sp. Wu6]|uniref:di-heme oxidoredictase family protein n=1 Tax=Methylomicrobium sp. Wu6 TaxID=3107928 RepID=UPI002DD66BE1|nr:di-heme oxidoredictase family protein [Methylomicrobium sp. Wu6]MEC4747491.1 di-heme oxidoredictase family protein [Methylomicrobium sp. Wu6]